MKNSVFTFAGIFFLSIFLSACGEEEVTPGLPVLPIVLGNNSEMMGTWASTEITYTIDDQVIDVSDHIFSFVMNVYENYSECSLNECNSWYSSAIWGENLDNYFGSQDTRCAIKIRIIEQSSSLLKVRIENITPYVKKLCPAERTGGYYVVSFARI